MQVNIINRQPKEAALEEELGRSAMTSNILPESHDCFLPLPLFQSLRCIQHFQLY